MQWTLTYGDYEARLPNTGWLRVWRAMSGWCYSVVGPDHDARAIGQHFPTRNAAMEAAKAQAERLEARNDGIYNHLDA